MLLFALDATRAFGAALAAALDVPLAPHEERTFEDGEHKLRPLVDPAGHDCVVVQSLHGERSASGDDKLVRLLMLLAALRDHGARRTIAVVPYLAYARKDRRAIHEALRKALGFPLAMTLGALAAVILFGEQILAIFGPEFTHAKLPLVILTPIPLTLIGIVLGHWLFRAAPCAFWTLSMTAG